MSVKKGLFYFLGIIISSFTVACGILSTANSFNTPTIPPSGITPIGSASPIATLTSTRTQPDDFVSENCLDVLPSAPANFKAQGSLVLQDYQTGKTFSLDLETDEKIPLTGENEIVSAFAVSPDRKTLAYELVLLEPSNKQQDELVLSDLTGKNKRVVLTPRDFGSPEDFSLQTWLNNQQLEFLQNGKWVVLNPYSGQEISYTLSDFPDFSTLDHNNFLALDPTLTKAIYRQGLNVVYDLASKQVTANIMNGFAGSPVASWSLDGSKAAIVGTTVVGQHDSDIGDDIFGLSGETQITQLTYLAKHYGEGLNILSMSWSPDSRFVAFWMRPPTIKDNWQLAVLDTETKKVTNYCILSDPFISVHQYLHAPIWSPDGKEIIIEHRAADSKYVVLLDTTQNIAFQIAQNSFPGGWMLPATP